MPVFDQKHELARCLEALVQQTYPPDRHQVIVVDNGSHENPGGLGKTNLATRRVWEKRPGSYAARNRGITATQGEILGFTDADCLPDPTWIERGVAALIRHPRLDAIGGKVRVFPKNPDHLTAVELHQIIRAFPQQRFVEALKFSTTANLFVRREAFEQVGLFEPALLSGGDAEWCQRLHATGGTLRYRPEVVVNHPARRTLAQVIQQRRRTAGGRYARQGGTGRPPSPNDDLEFAYGSPFRRAAQYASDGRLESRADRLRFTEVVLSLTARLEFLRLQLGGKQRR